MIFYIVRWSAFLIVIFIAVIIKKRNKNNKKIWRKIISVSIICFLISFYVPVENLFITFSTPEAAFKYGCTGEVRDMIDGKESTLILYSPKQKTRSQVVFSKTERGWKINPFSIPFKEKSGASQVSIYKSKNSIDYYVVVHTIILDRKSVDNINIFDNKNTIFRCYIKEYESYLSILNYACINNYDENYELIIDGEIFTFD